MPSFTISLAVRLFFVKLRAPAWVISVLGPLLVKILEKMVSLAIVKIDLTLEALIDGMTEVEFKKQALIEYNKVISKRWSEDEKKVWRKQFQDTLAPLVEYGSGVRKR